MTNGWDSHKTLGAELSHACIDKAPQPFFFFERIVCSKSIHIHHILFGDSSCSDASHLFRCSEVVYRFQILRIFHRFLVNIDLSKLDLKKRSIFHGGEGRAARDHEIPLERSWLQSFDSSGRAAIIRTRLPFRQSRIGAGTSRK
jgi:hypothetical protein